ncbi:MAG: hypothetical protein F6K58_10155 [Symploca sp. SIO2E9]|nr:hypothetical protein [Symploca sp. SIO2E9]
MTNRIYAPNIHLFAFHLRNGSNSEEENFLWQQCNQIFGQLDIKEPTNTPLKLTNYLDLQRQPHLRRTELLTNNQTFLPFSGQIYLNQSPLHSEGFAYPLRIDDSYALWLNIRRPEKENNQPTAPVSTEFLKEFNRKNCLLFKQSDYFLGQTLLITAWLTLEHKQLEHRHPDCTRKLADQCLEHLILDQSLRPSFYRQGELFGSPIFEYGLITQSTNYRHLLVWLVRTPETDKKFNLSYQQLLDLFFYRNKITKAFHNSREVYKELESQYKNIEQQLTQLEKYNPNQKLNESELEQLQSQLKTMPNMALNYTYWLRLLEDYQNTIAINIHNYQEKLEQIQRDTSETNLSFLEEFIAKNALTFQEQIQRDLNYFLPGNDLIDKAIASIRGIVEIEQTRIERQRQETEKKIQNDIEAIGVGIAAGAFVASSSGLITQKWSLPGSPKSSPYPHPFLISLILSSLVAIIAWGIIRIWQHRRKP